MSEGASPKAPEDQIIDRINSLDTSNKSRVWRKFLAAALGSIPWIGGFLAAMMAIREENAQSKVDALQREWLEEHKSKMEALALELTGITNRLSSLGDGIAERLESEEYLAIVRKGFRLWDQADTAQKRTYIARLLANAGATALCEDDLVRLFLEWLEKYHESHFKVIREIYQNPGSTRHDIWQNIHGDFPREDSSEADLYRLLIGDLSQGRIIRQHRDTNHSGQFYKKQKTPTPKGQASTTMKSAFDDEEPYELTELGKKFVHYVFSDIVQRLDS